MADQRFPSVLANKPLVEAIFEAKWKLETGPQGELVDPHYKLLPGRLFERLSNEYPIHEPLPASTFPDEMVAHTAQHRFRKKPGGWPLVQVGPGVLTLNDTEGYVWTDFAQRAIAMVDALFSVYPKADELQLSGLSLRYLDAIGFNPRETDAFAFLRENFHTSISLPDGLFARAENRLPSALSFQSAFGLTRPRGLGIIRFNFGRKLGEPALIWETLVSSQAKDVPRTPRDIAGWLEDAHEVTHDWFFAMIDSKLLERFK